MKKHQGAFIKNARELENLREANRLTANVLDAIGDEIRPGIPTMQLEDLARAMCDQYHVRPAFLGYAGFPYAICCSVNEVVVHGFPSSSRILQEGDIVSVDFGVEYNGMVGDSARTFAVGQISEVADRLLYVTECSLFEGISQAIAGHDVHEIGAAVQRYVEARGFGVVRRYVGHGGLRFAELSLPEDRRAQAEHFYKDVYCPVHFACKNTLTKVFDGEADCLAALRAAYL